MLLFEKLSLEDIESIRTYFSYSISRTCDNTVGAIFMWRGYFNTEFCIFNDTLIIKFSLVGNKTAFLLPLGRDVNGSLCEMELYCKACNIPLTFFMVADEEIAIIKQLYPTIHIEQHQNWIDYLYRAEDLSTFAGRRFSGQRNHMNHFIRTYSDFCFEEIDDQNLPEVVDMYNSVISNVSKETDFFIEDKKGTVELLDNYKKYGLFGGLMRAAGKVVAFSVGEIHRDTLFVHVERADNTCRGSYQMIVNNFSRHFAADGIQFINRGEDLGDEGLRTAKQALHPFELISKYTVIVEA